MTKLMIISIIYSLIEANQNTRTDAVVIDLFHIVSAHACIAHMTRYFSIIGGETLHRWGKQLSNH